MVIVVHIALLSSAFNYRPSLFSDKFKKKNNFKLGSRVQESRDEDSLGQILPFLVDYDRRIQRLKNNNALRGVLFGDRIFDYCEEDRILECDLILLEKLINLYFNFAEFLDALKREDVVGDKVLLEEINKRKKFILDFIIEIDRARAGGLTKEASWLWNAHCCFREEKAVLDKLNEVFVITAKKYPQIDFGLPGQSDWV